VTTCSAGTIRQNRLHNCESGGCVTVHLMRKCLVWFDNSHSATAQPKQHLFVRQRKFI